jgi:hypothetical protein
MKGCDANLIRLFNLATLLIAQQRKRKSNMKTILLMTVLMVSGLALFSGCAMMQTWPESERSAENKMVAIQENIGDGLKSGALSLDQSQVFLTTLKGIRTDYSALRYKMVYQEEWNVLQHRLDMLGDDVNRALSRTTRMEEPRNAERIHALQRRIDDGRSSGRLPRSEGQEVQARLDSIRSDYMRMTDEGRYAVHEERTDISRRLDALENDLDRFR